MRAQLPRLQAGRRSYSSAPGRPLQATPSLGLSPFAVLLLHPSIYHPGSTSLIYLFIYLLIYLFIYLFISWRLITLTYFFKGDFKKNFKYVEVYWYFLN